MTANQSLEKEASKRGQVLLRGLQKQDRGSILDSPCILLLDEEDVDLKKICNEMLVVLKAKYDQKNVCEHSMPIYI